MKPCFSNKRRQRGHKLLQGDSKVAEELTNFFKEAISALDNENSYVINPYSISISDFVEKAIISQHKFHPSILLTNNEIGNQNKFSFKPISKLDIKKKINLLTPN